jgi:hypothetical protein
MKQLGYYNPGLARQAVCEAARLEPTSSSAALKLRRPGFAILAVLLSLLLTRAGCAQGLGVAESSELARKHLDFVGKPCLQTAGVARPLVSNPRIIDHAVRLDNHCLEPIKAKICYYRTDECRDVTVPARSQKEEVIGVFPAISCSVTR